MATPADTLVDLRPRVRPWHLECRGSFVLKSADGRDVGPRGRKARAIVAYLAVHSDEHVSRDRLIELFWSDRGLAQARGSLRQSLLEIRRAAPQLIGTDQQHVWIDRQRVQIREPEHLSGDEVLFGDLDGITLEFDDWLRSERIEQGTKEWSELFEEAESKLEKSLGTSAIPLIERMERLDPYNEDWLRLAMRAEFQAGHPAGIQTRFNKMAEDLKRDLGVNVSAQTKALHDKLLADLSFPAANSQYAADAGTTPQSPTKKRRRRPALRRPGFAATGIAALAIILGLTQSARPAASPPPRIAVLPFDASAGTDRDLAEGMSDELISLLAQNGQLRVIGQTSADQIKGRFFDLPSIARQLRVDYLIDGKLRGTGDKVDIRVSLARGRDGSVVWARRFSGSREQLPSLQRDIDEAIAASLGVPAPAQARPTPNGEAYALYLEAKGLMRDRTEPSLQAAIRLLREAVSLDQGFAGAWAQMAAAAYLSGQSDIFLDPGNPEGPTITRRQAAERALKLDPNLAEGHAMMALIDDFGRARGRAHLVRALQLNPGDSQTLLWWASAVGLTGDSRLSNMLARKSAALDPLWERPVSAAARGELDAGNPRGGERFLRTIRLYNPEGAAEAEAHYAVASGDFSRAVQLTLGDRHAPWSSAKETGARTLIGLGFVREGLSLGRFGPLERATYLGHVPDRTVVMKQIRKDASEDDNNALWGMIPELGRAHRWSDIAAIYDSEVGRIADVRDADPGGRVTRVTLGPILVLALNKVGRGREAAKLALRVDAAGRFMLARGEVPGFLLVEIAATEALLGRHDDALAHIEQAFAKGWRLHETSPLRLGQNPCFATLLGDPRFERLRKIQDAHLKKERREVAALGIL